MLESGVERISKEAGVKLKQDGVRGRGREGVPKEKKIAFLIWDWGCGLKQ